MDGEVDGDGFDGGADDDGAGAGASAAPGMGQLLGALVVEDDGDGVVFVDFAFASEDLFASSERHGWL